MKYLGLTTVLVLGGCGGDGITGSRLTVATLAGTWSMSRFQPVNAADSTDRVDPLPGGTSGILEVTSAGAYAFTLSFPGVGIRIETGTHSVRGDTLTYDGEADEVAFLLVLTGNSMTWRALEADLFDLNGDGVPEETYARVPFVRV